MRGRFAPSPTGALHLGNARTALLAWLQVKRQGGALVLRMEDLDRARTVPGAAESQLQALRALGITWDEGPDVGGPFGPYTQSARLPRYQAAVDALRAAGRIYPCYCSRAEISRIAQAPHVGDDGPPYPGTCRHLTERERAQREAAGKRPALRFRVTPGIERFDDEIAGPVSQDVEAQVGDFVVQRADGVFAYQLAVVVDDAAMQITHVLRGDDLVGSTARQLQLFRALGEAPPRFAHVGLLYDANGERMAKRDGSADVSALLERGVTAAKVRAVLDGLCGFDGWVENFDLAQVPRGPQRLTARAAATLRAP